MRNGKYWGRRNHKIGLTSENWLNWHCQLKMMMNPTRANVECELGRRQLCKFEQFVQWCSITHFRRNDPKPNESSGMNRLSKNRAGVKHMWQSDQGGKQACALNWYGTCLDNRRYRLSRPIKSNIMSFAKHKNRKTKYCFKHRNVKYWPLITQLCVNINRSFFPWLPASRTLVFD